MAIRVSFKIPVFAGYCHHNNEFYLAGGMDDGKYFNNFRKISFSGMVKELKSMPTPNSSFGMTNWSRGNLFITVGGENYSKRLA